MRNLIDTDDIYARFDEMDDKRRSTVRAAKAQRVRKDTRGKAVR